jgi:AmmeMemoRadiSam system protein B
MIVFASICPHPPLLIPTIGKENLKQVKKTETAMKKLEEDFYAAKPDTVVIISPHSPLIPNAFGINMAENYTAHLNDFGDFSFKLHFAANKDLAHRLKERAEDQQFPVVLVSQPELDHGITVPLFYLTRHRPNIPLVPLSFSMMDLPTHLKFGKIIRDEIQSDKSRVAVVASGDLSHRLTEGAPAGYSAMGARFDRELTKLIKKNNVEGILGLDQELVDEAGECGLRSITILLGILDEINYQPEILSYEGPFGVGYLVANFKLS